MIRTYMQQNRDWFANSDPFSLIGDMESEIAELRTLTKVTRLRKQIECREEGAWVVVKDIPDDKAPSGTRKVTSYGITKRSVTSTRSISSNVDFNNVFDSEVSTEPLVQLPGEESDHHSKPSTVEITEVFEEPLRREVPEFNKNLIPEKIINKKTSVITLGKGNLVLIDPEEDESNFHVTGISKGKVADVVSTLERSSEKKVKKVGFCKTEVHFAPDSGKINIVETDEKPPPTQVYRKKKRTRGAKSSRASSCLPKHYFGEMDDFGEDSNLSESDKEDNKTPSSVIPERGVLADVKEKLPIFEKTIKSEGKDLKYRHSSPDKNSFDIEKVESEGKEFLKKVKQPSFRDKFLKETIFVPEKMCSNSRSNLDSLVKNLDKHPRLKDNLYIYGSCAYSQEGEPLKSNSKLSGDDNITVSNKNSPSNTRCNLYHSNQDVGDREESRLNKEDESGQNLRYVELLKLPSLSGDKDALKQQVNIDENIPEVRNIPIVKTNCISENNYAKLKKGSISDMRLDISRTSRIPVDQDVQPGMSFLGHVSPKLQNLIQNSVEHEFQLRQKQILQKRSAEEKTQTSRLVDDNVKTSISLNVSSKNDEEKIIIGTTEPKLKPVKIVTQIHLGPESKNKHEFQVKREEITNNLFGDPVYDNKDIKFKESPYLLNEEPVPAPRAKKEPQIKKDISKVPPKPKPRTITSVPLDKSRTPRTPTNRVTSRAESSLNSKRVKSKESISRKESDKNITRSTILREDGKCKKLLSQATKIDSIPNRAPRVIKVTTEGKGNKKTGREPLRSFEKVSNGWVGHIVPLKQDGITVTTKVYSSSRSGTQGLHSSGSKRSSHTNSTVKTSQSHSSRVDVRRDSKQFSLSKEHLSSAKLVKEVTPKRGSSARKVGSKTERGSTVGSYRPRPRRESERSDDSVVQADEEVRAYMFDGNKNKEVNCCPDLEDSFRYCRVL